MKIAYFDCFSGISGDMTLGALIDAGVPLDHLRSELAGLGVGGWAISAEKALKNGLGSTSVTVKTQEGQTHRSLTNILSILQKSGLAAPVKERAAAIFRRLGEAEAAVHNTAIESVHFHEVGALDAIVDIVGACIGFAALGVDRFACSPLNVGGGTITMAHGVWPAPAPATARLLLDKPTYSNGIQRELVTPTGAAIVSTLCENFGPQPTMTVSAIGYGAGRAELEGQPNVLRLMIGEAEAIENVPGRTETIQVLEANLDDMNPQIYGYFQEKALAAGALDVFATPVQMKKNRPGMLVTVLCKPQDAGGLSRLLFEETTTLGVRSHFAERRVLSRHWYTVHTRFGEVRMKVASSNGRTLHASPEFDDCRKLAEEAKVPVQTVMEEAVREWGAKE